ncbi:hypothetical protein ABKN59_004444 [Abortiporus biennis]
MVGFETLRQIISVQIGDSFGPTRIVPNLSGLLQVDIHQYIHSCQGITREQRTAQQPSSISPKSHLSI